MSERARLTAVLAFFTLCGASCMDREGLQVGPGSGTGGGGGRASGTGGASTGVGGAPWGVGGGIVSGVGGAPNGAGGAPNGAGGKGGPGGTKGGTGGAIITCGPICDIYCQWGNVIDAKGCPTCACNPPPACDTKECPPPPPFAQPICDGGMVVPPTCGRNTDGTCSWSAPRCTGICPAIACPLNVCAYGYKTDSNGCATCECNPPPACTASECGPGPLPPTMICPDGGTAGPVCSRGSNGKCSWTITSCQTVCPPIACLVACPYGSRRDANGCDTCDCLPAPDCTAHGDAASCQADTSCTWLVPGCGTPALASQGCYARTDVGCTSDSSCSGGRSCLKRVVNPCPPTDGGGTCTACGLTQTICL